MLNSALTPQARYDVVAGRWQRGARGLGTLVGQVVLLTLPFKTPMEMTWLMRYSWLL